jgi:predicted phosphodiesterase
MSQSIGVLSDCHGNLPALEAVIADLKRHGISDVVNLGDHASGPLWPRETVTLLMQQPWRQISGNHDRQVVADPPATHGATDQFAFAQLTDDHKAWLRALPPTAMHPSGVLLCHGTPATDMEFLLEQVDAGRIRLDDATRISSRLGPTSASVTLCGHSHMPRLAHTVDGRMVMNPGSVGLQGFIDDSTDPPYRVETGSPHARYALLQRDGGAWSVMHLAIPYDYEAAARRAERNGQPAWAHALRTGFAG